MTTTTTETMPAEFTETTMPACTVPGSLGGHAWDICEFRRRVGHSTVDALRCGYCGARMCRIIPDLDPATGGQLAWIVRYAKS